MKQRGTTLNRVDAAIRLCLLAVSITAIFWGISEIANIGAAAAVTGGMVWLDLTKERHERNSELPSRSTRRGE